MSQIYHSKQPEIELLVKHKMNVLLEGEAGSGKSTIIKYVAKKLDLDFYTISMTKQTTLNTLIGFKSINGTYVPSLLRKAVEEGGLMLLDELDAADPNVILCLNTLENGYLACPDKNVDVHENFRLCATANPSDEHQIYTGRSKLDGATLSRFDIVRINRDEKLEASLVCENTFKEIQLMRKILKEKNASKTLSMRDAIRLHKRKEINLAKDYELVLLGESLFVSEYNTRLEKMRPKIAKKQSDCKTIDELWESISTPGKHYKSSLPTKDDIREDVIISKVAWDDVANMATSVTPSAASSNRKDKYGGYPTSYLKDLARSWFASGQNMVLPSSIRIKMEGPTPHDPYNIYISIFIDNKFAFKIDKEELKNDTRR